MSGSPSCWTGCARPCAQRSWCLGGALVLAFMIMLALRTHDGLLQVMGRRDSTLNLAIPMLWFWGPMLAGFALSVPAIVLLILRHMLRLPTPHESEDA